MIDFSSVPVFSAFTYPRNQRISPLKSRSLGPVAIDDVSEGIASYVWEVAFSNGHLRIRNEKTPWITLLEIDGVTHLDLAFDQSGTPFVAYQLFDGVYIYGFDLNARNYVNTRIAAGASSPFVDLDIQVAYRGNIVVSYQIDHYIFYRLQRDRYEIAYPVLSSSGEQFKVDRLVGASMGRGNRFIFKGIPLGDE
ncbi:hypothetical protein [Marinagarivorans algicola]|uniref:hypothetical protein n=1 Tax=Marinagarivorans algicola TaxID=1513270 RepID=UPI0006B5589F|nr:hypothetical protein [Marinagarivorans algicola]